MEKIKGLIWLYKCIKDKECDDKDGIIRGIEYVCNKVKCSSRVKNLLIGLVDPR